MQDPIKHDHNCVISFPEKKKNPFSVSVYLICVSLLVTLTLKSVLGMVFTSFLYMGFWLQVIFSHMCKFPVDTLLYKLLLDP